MLTNIGNIWQKCSLNIVKIFSQKITLTYFLFITKITVADDSCTILRV